MVYITPLPETFGFDLETFGFDLDLKTFGFDLDLKTFGFDLHFNNSIVLSHIRHGGLLGQQRLAAHLTSVVACLSWQPKRYLNESFVFSSYFKSS